ncbi:VaFE repeat-containing surface-anchored protein [Enterococcus hailinensis]|uniref:VaFE repeat-containing surface-anchored protein n=1 Tax=Enterococcus hailinensis TaxID=3238988 RepID=UPI0038B2568E
MKKNFGKLLRIVLAILMVISNIGFFNIRAEAAVEWWGSGPDAGRNNAVLGKRYPASDTGSIALSFGSYSTGGKTLGSNSVSGEALYAFCIEMGVAVKMDNMANDGKVNDALGAFLVDHFINRGTPTGAAWDALSEAQQNDYRLTHAAMGMYFRDNYEIASTKSTYTAAKAKLENRDDWKQISARLQEMTKYAEGKLGAYSGTLTFNQNPNQQSATVDFSIKANAGSGQEMKNVDPYDVTLTATNGTFTNNGTSTLTFKSNAAPTITVVPTETGDVSVAMNVKGLPGTKLTKYSFSEGQDFMMSLIGDRQDITVTEKVPLIKPFKIDATTSAPDLLKVGENLKDAIDVKLIGGTTWSSILGKANEKVPAKLMLDWYYSETDFGDTSYPLENLPEGVQKLNDASEVIEVTNTGVYEHTSDIEATKYGFYYPVIRFAIDDQEGYQNYFVAGSDFQKPFNDKDEQSLVKWQPKVVTENLIVNDENGATVEGHRLPATGGTVKDRLKVTDNKSDQELTIVSKLYGPFLTKPDFIKNGNQHDGGKAVTIPGNVEPYETVKTVITGNGTVETPEVTIAEEDKGWYVWVESIEGTDYTEQWNSHFGSENEYVLVPWDPGITTKVSTTSAHVGQQVHDQIKVTDMPGMWGLLGDGEGNTANKYWNTHPELKGKNQDPSSDGEYNMPDGWGESKEDTALTATFTMYYSPTKPVQGDVPEGAVVFDTVKAPLISGSLNTTEFKRFDKPGYYTVVVTGGDDEGRVATFQTDYGIPSETVHVTTNEEYFTKVNEERVHIGDLVYDTLHVTASPINNNAEATFTLYKYSDKADSLDFSNPQEIATSSKPIAITKAGEYPSNTKGHGLENLTMDSVGTYGWVVTVVDKSDDDNVLYEGTHGEYGEVFSVTEVDLKTSAVDSETGMNEGLASERVTITDTVTYTGLIPGNQYTISGVLMDKETGKEFLTSEGDKVTATKNFTAKEADGSETLEFVIKKGDLAGKTIVVFESLEYQNREIAVHADIEDKDQTVSYPKVGTKASQVSGLEDEYITIKDQVSYENLRLGVPYTVKGVLMNKETNKPFMVKDEKGAEVTVTGEATIPAEHEGSGMIDVEFTFPRSALTEDLELVVFEELFNVEGKLVGEHKDIDDEEQTVRQPEIRTKASDKETGTNIGLATDNVTIVDEVSYRNLIVGKTYTVKGVLMDKETGQPFLTRENKEVRAEKEFTATQSNGTVNLEFVIQQGDLAGKTIVVFEDLYEEGKKIATHSDIEDKDQTVHYPKVGTQAVELSEDTDETVIIRDIIYYENLIPGESYTARGKLMLKEANAPFTVFGREVEGHATFVASETGTGYVTMDFAFSRSVLSNDVTLVVFERIYDASGNLIGKHEDINDEAQTLSIKKPTDPDTPSEPNDPSEPGTPGGNLPTTKGSTTTGTPSGSGGSSSGSSGGTLPTTGEQVMEILPYLGALIIIGAAAIYFYQKRRHAER